MTDPERVAGAPPPAPPTLVQAGLHGLCPRCGASTLFAGWIRFADRCRACDLDFHPFNVGDGPAAFLTLILGTLWVTLAVIAEIVWSPPLWLHALVWVPLTVASVIWSLRLAKGALMSAEFRNAAHEGRIVP